MERRRQGYEGLPFSHLSTGSHPWLSPMESLRTAKAGKFFMGTAQTAESPADPTMQRDSLNPSAPRPKTQKFNPEQLTTMAGYHQGEILYFPRIPSESVITGSVFVVTCGS